MTNEDAIRVFESWIEQDKNLKYADRLENIEIYQIAIEALKAQRPHGEWVKKVINGMPCIVCSTCLSPRHPEVGYDWYNIYCGHCGSRNKLTKKEGDKE